MQKPAHRPSVPARRVVQDDSRERELIEVCGLRRPANASRGGLDAVLDLDGTAIPFEVKSTTRGSVTTARDFGPAHARKWKGRHWLIGMYDADDHVLQCIRYGAPAVMRRWVHGKLRDMAFDRKFDECIPQLAGEAELDAILGHRTEYPRAIARSLLRKQLTKAELRALEDRPGGYSRECMLELMRMRLGYVLRKGAKANNPHVPVSFVRKLPKLEGDHAGSLRALVRAAVLSP